MHNVCAVVKLTSLAILLPVGSPPPLGLRFCQNIEWLMCPPPLNLIAFCTAMTPLTSSAHRECTGKFTERGTQQEIGMLQFAVMGQTGVAEFTAFPSLLATADLNLTNILEEGSITPAVVQLEITNSVQRRSVPAENSVTKSTSSRRVRRQTDNDACTGPYPTGDINGDCDVDLRDSYYFQEYIQAEVHNFTGSDKGAAIQENINSKNINLDVDGDGIVSLVDIVYSRAGQHWTSL